MSALSENFPAKNVPEGDLVGRLGIARPVLRILREELLSEGADWELRDKQIWLTEPAVEKIRAGYLRLKPAEKTPEAKPEPEIPKNGPEAAPTVDLHELYVWKADGLGGGRMLQARTAGGVLVMVRVQRSDVFCKGMVLYARKLGAGVYEFVGAYPRWRGDRLYKPGPEGQG